ncbi:MAG: hypothetical protein WDA37_03935 [Dysgonamonadaceae bacterium]
MGYLQNDIKVAVWVSKEKKMSQVLKSLIFKAGKWSIRAIKSGIWANNRLLNHRHDWIFRYVGS